MKKVQQIKNLFFLLILMLLVSVTMADEQKKTFHEKYDVNADAELIISNEYGNVVIETWDKNQVVIDIVITVDGKSESKAKEILDKIVINFNGSPSVVKVETYIKGKLSCNNCKLNIDYDIKMPATNKLDLKNSFGNAHVGDLSGKTNFKISYGNLTLGKLGSKENVIDMNFGDVDIEKLKAADINMEYGSLELGEAGYLDLYVRFAGVEMGSVSELILDGEYESAEIGSVNLLRAKLSFMGLEIGELFDKLDIITTYGVVEVSRVSGGFSSIDITTEFGGVELGISSSASYKLEASNSFGDINFPESRAEVKKYVKDSFNSEIEAFIGDDASSLATVVIKATNSGVDIH